LIYDAAAIIEAGKKEQGWVNVGTLKEPATGMRVPNPPDLHPLRQRMLRPTDSVVLFNSSHAMKYARLDATSPLPIIRSYEEYLQFRSPQS
jgi:hypothetical protein